MYFIYDGVNERHKAEVFCWHVAIFFWHVAIFFWHGIAQIGFVQLLYLTDRQLRDLGLGCFCELDCLIALGILLEGPTDLGGEGAHGWCLWLGF